MAVVWITGASSGLGLYTAKAIKAAGNTVVSGARSFDGKEGESEEGFRLSLDVTKPESMDTFCQRALSLYGVPDCLVLCAGYLVWGSCEGYTQDEIRGVMNTNFFGQTEMIQRVLPLMRKNGGGKIVCYSSINGVLSTPFQGAYSASKHALEGYCEALRMECEPFGVQVTLIEPGDHSGGSQTYRHISKGTGADSAYKASFDRVHAVIDHDEGNGSDPAVLGRKVAKLLSRKKMPMRKCIASADQHLSILLHRVLPGTLFAKIISGYYKVNGKKE